MNEITYTLVTGSSTGIGREIARYCGSLGMNVLLVSLPGENLKGVADEINKKNNVITDFFETDLSNLNGPEDVFRWVTSKDYNVSILVNNAGIAGTACFDVAELKYHDDRILVNVRALVLLTRLFLPMLKSKPHSYILNIGSLSAFFCIPYKSVYSATKAFVVNFSRAIKYELKDTTVSVSVICPNGVRTNPGTSGRIDAHGLAGKLTSVSAERIAQIAVDGMLSRKFLIIPGFLNRSLLVLQKILPVSLQQRILVHEFMKEVRHSDNLQ